MKRSGTGIGVFVLMVAAGACGGRSKGEQSPISTVAGSRPGPCQVALAPGPRQREIDQTIARLQQQAEGVRWREALEQLGYQFVTRARLRNDPGDYTLAEHAAACLESRRPADPAALLVRGHALHQLHRFAEAEALARQLVARREFALDYGLLGDTLMEQGQLDEAAAAYQRMIDLKPFYQSYARAAHLRWLKGDVNGAVDLIRRAIKTAAPGNREAIAWAHTRLALFELQRGRLAEAARAVDAALTAQPDYAAALLARGRVLLAQNRPVDAIGPLRRAATLNPLPEYQWALADALRLTGSKDEAESVEHELTATGAELDPRTLALFLATRRSAVDEAVKLTDRELQRRSDVFTHDARAWALFASGRTGEASAAMTRALAEQTEDARLFLHAGIVAAAAGRRAEGRGWLRRADAARATLLPSELAELRRYLQRS